ncbi:MAG: phosphoribosylformylglycinamidine synthase subunit PurQ [Oscillospiraceae bacterium]|nr:phosphoribosylformylglycinamidine synthase subunit PurQ [Oscillospiraceae bacterium]
MEDKVYRCYVEKKSGFDIASESIQNELSDVLGLPALKVRLFNRYDVQGVSEEDWSSVVNTVLSEPMCDQCYEDELPSFSTDTRLLFVESLPGQFDIRADSCEQCIQMLLGGNRPAVQTALVYAIEGLDEASYDRVRTYLINPVECREASAEKPDTLLKDSNFTHGEIPHLVGFVSLGNDELETLRINMGMAMSLSDLQIIQEYFIEEKRDPTLTEIKVLDTYWSDHCRHTTFNTIIENVDIKDSRVEDAYNNFLSIKGDRPISLMSIATAAMRHLSKEGKLPMLDQSDENNACTIRISAKFPHGDEDWLLFFKNETHNHPTEIEPFGGAATCIGGAIRDPLSGRSYVYQSMRITGSGDPRKAIEDTLPGKLPQRKLTTSAAHGFSSYGNQIGLATGFVKELYHEGYIAKRMEVGAVVGAAPVSQIKRERPASGDIVVVLGGRTGRDGIGGATGSSVTHTTETVSQRGSEVQKGNAPEERKLQRLFRNPEVTKLIKKCNDFGAGGVSVAVGELADGVEIHLDALPVKYDGLDGTELAISESQERMAVVVAAEDFDTLRELASQENIEASLIANVTESRRLVMIWQGQRIVDISRDFLDKNGAPRWAEVSVGIPEGNDSLADFAGTSTAADFTTVAGAALDSAATDSASFNTSKSSDTLNERLLALCEDLNYCSQKGLVERFDNSIGAASVLQPHGGKYALTETQVMAALLPVLDTSDTNIPTNSNTNSNTSTSISSDTASPPLSTSTASVMAYGFDPYHTQADPFGGSVNAVVTSVAKLIASGVPRDTIHLSLQEYFPRLGDDPSRWGMPFAAILGAFTVQMGLGIAAIGGKDSMSGSFGEMDVPPTLISFAVGVTQAETLISPEFKAAGNPVYMLETPIQNASKASDGVLDYDSLLTAWDNYATLLHSGKILSAWVCEKGGVHGGIMKMALGNMIGFKGQFEDDLINAKWGSIVFEATEHLDGFLLLGYTNDESTVEINDTIIKLDLLREKWEAPLESIFPIKAQQSGNVPLITYENRGKAHNFATFARPKAVIPVFPGTNCEYDTMAAINRAGGVAEFVLIRNLTAQMLEDSISALEKAISTAQMIVFPGGFSGGDEPDGSGKFIVSLFMSERLSNAVHGLLDERDGLILGICNGFQALIKLGLVPYGRIAPMSEEKPTLTFNKIGRHQARYVSTRVSSVLSPWLSKCNSGEMYVQPISHGEGRLIASTDILEDWEANGQIVFQYTDFDGEPTLDIAHNPNGSDWAIEGISSADGRILGKMAHPERSGENVAINIPGNKYLPIFEGGVSYFR